MEFAVALVAVVAIAGFVFLLDRQERRFGEERRAWQMEREGWIMLVQNPNTRPVLAERESGFVEPEEDPDDDELALVGTVMPGVGEADAERDEF